MVVETSPAPALVIAKPNLLLQFVVGYNIPFSGFLVACNAIDSRYLVGAAENSPPSPIRSPGPFDSRPSLDRYPRLLGRQKVRVHGRAVLVPVATCDEQAGQRDRRVGLIGIDDPIRSPVVAVDRADSAG